MLDITEEKLHFFGTSKENNSWNIKEVFAVDQSLHNASWQKSFQKLCIKSLLEIQIFFQQAR